MPSFFLQEQLMSCNEYSCTTFRLKRITAFEHGEAMWKVWYTNTGQMKSDSILQSYCSSFEWEYVNILLPNPVHSHCPFADSWVDHNSDLKIEKIPVTHSWAFWIVVLYYFKYHLYYMPCCCIYFPECGSDDDGICSSVKYLL